MAEKEQQHRHATETSVIQAEIQRNKEEYRSTLTALWLSFFVVIALAVLGFFLTLNGHDWVGGIVMGTTLVGVITAFLGRLKHPNNSR